MELYKNGAYLLNGRDLFPEENQAAAQARAGQPVDRETGRQGTIAWSILQSHNTSGDPQKLKIRYDALTSHDLTYVGIIQTARASGMDHFPMPYVLTCCHNSLCAVGGTINEDDHLFGLTAAKKYGGIFVPPHVAVIHQYMREMHAGCGKMILGSDSHTRYGALGTMAVGEGGGELDKQILGDTWDTDYPEVVAVYLTGRPQPWVGPQDIALALCRAVFQNGYVKNKVMEFVGPGVSSMTTDYRNAVDVMTTETTCLSSIWRTDEDTRAFLKEHGREEDYRELNPGAVAYYDGCIPGSVHGEAHDCPAFPSLQRLYHRRTERQPGRHPPGDGKESGGGGPGTGALHPHRQDPGREAPGPAGGHRRLLRGQLFQCGGSGRSAPGPFHGQRGICPERVSFLPAGVHGFNEERDAG